MTTDSPQVSDATFVRRRRISPRRAARARACDRIISEYGAVTGTTAFPERYQARWRARYLIGLLVELDLRERRELIEHTERLDGGWGWVIEWAGPPGAASPRG